MRMSWQLLCNKILGSRYNGSEKLIEILQRHMQQHFISHDIRAIPEIPADQVVGQSWLYSL